MKTQVFLMILIFLLSQSSFAKTKVYTANVKERLEREIPVIIDKIPEPFQVAVASKTILKELKKLVDKGMIHQDSFEAIKKKLATINKNSSRSDFKKEVQARFRSLLNETEKKGPVCSKRQESCHEMPCCEGYRCLQNAPLSFPRSQTLFHQLATLEEQLSNKAQKVLKTLNEVCDSKIKNPNLYTKCIENLYIQHQLLIESEKKHITPLKKLYPKCLETDVKCTDNADCCSNYCTTKDDKDKNKYCAPVAICVPKLELGAACLPSISACPPSSFCQKSNINSTNLDICTENDKECKTDEDCCSLKCHQNKCLSIFRCMQCIPGYKEVKPDQQCCEGFYNVDDRCLPDYPPYPPQAQKKTIQKSILKKTALLLLNLFVSTANATMTEDDLPQDVKNQIASERATCNAMKNATQKANCLAEVDTKVQQQMALEEKKQTQQYAIDNELSTSTIANETVDNIWSSLTQAQRDDCETKAKERITEGAGSLDGIPEETILQEAKNICYTELSYGQHQSFDDIGNVFDGMNNFVLSEEVDGSTFKTTCMFDLRAQDYAEMNDVEKKAELILLAYEFVASGQGTDDCWDEKGDSKCAGGSTIHSQANDIARKLKAARTVRYEELSRLEKDLRCSCFDIKNIAEFKEPWATPQIKDYYRNNCPNGKRIDQPDDSGENRGERASGVEYTELLLKSVEKRKEQLQKVFERNTENSAIMMGLLTYIKVLPFAEINKRVVTYYQTVRKHIWLIVLGVLLTVVAFCLLPVLTGPLIAVAVTVFAVGAPLGLILCEIFSGTPSEECIEVGRSDVYWPCEPILVAYDIRLKCEKVEVLESDICGFTLPNALCIKSALTLRDDATLAAGNIRYLIDPFFPALEAGNPMQSFLNTHFVSPKDSANFELGNNFLESHRQKFLDKAQTFARQELYFASNDLLPYANYIYQYHFLGKAITSEPRYPTPGLIPYFEMVDNALQTLSFSQANLLNNLNLYHQKLYGFYTDMVKRYTPGAEIPPSIQEAYDKSLVMSKLFDNFKHNAMNSEIRKFDFSSGSLGGSNGGSGGSGTGSLSSLENAMNKAAQINRQQSEQYKKWKETVGKTRKGKKLLAAHNHYQETGLTASILRSTYKDGANSSTNGHQRRSSLFDDSATTENTNPISSSKQNLSKGISLTNKKSKEKESNKGDEFGEDFFDGMDFEELFSGQVIDKKEIKTINNTLSNNIDQQTKINKSNGMSLFKIITERYFATGYRRLLKIRKKR